MKKDLKIIAVTIITLAIMFATTLVLDFDLVQKKIIRQVIIYIIILIEFALGVLYVINTSIKK